MTSEASIIFRPGSGPQKFTLHGTGPGIQWHWPSPDNYEFKGSTWRFLADGCAVELWPLCDDEAQLALAGPPNCDRLEIHPVAWGYPDSLIEDHPAELEQWRQRHRAGECELTNGNLTWPELLAQVVKPDLFVRFYTEDMARHWLNKLYGPGQPLFLFAGMAVAGRTTRVPKSILPEIKFRADFYRGDVPSTIYLRDCQKGQLSVEERKLSPTHVAKEEARIHKLSAATSTAHKVHKDLEQQFDRMQKFWPDTPAAQRARTKILSQNVPLAFLDWVLAQQDLTGQWPEGHRALSACKEKGWRGKRRGMSLESVFRWIRVIRTERQKVGLDTKGGEDAMRHKTRHATLDAIADEPQPVSEEQPDL